MGQIQGLKRTYPFAIFSHIRFRGSMSRCRLVGKKTTRRASGGQFMIILLLNGVSSSDVHIVI